MGFSGTNERYALSAGGLFVSPAQPRAEDGRAQTALRELRAGIPLRGAGRAAFTISCRKALRSRESLGRQWDYRCGGILMKLSPSEAGGYELHGKHKDVKRGAELLKRRERRCYADV